MRFNVFEQIFLRGIAGRRLMNGISNDEMQTRTVMGRILSDRVVSRVLRWFRDKENINEWRLVEKGEASRGE